MGIRTPETNSSARASTALTSTLSSAPGEMAALRLLPAAPQVIRQVSGEHADDCHVQYIRAKRQDTAVLKESAWIARIAVITTLAAAGPRVHGEKGAAYQVTAGAHADGKIDHLRGKHERTHHAKQRRLGFIEAQLRTAGGKRRRRRGQRIQRGPHGCRQKTVGYVHDRLQSSTNAKNRATAAKNFECYYVYA